MTDVTLTTPSDRIAPVTEALIDTLGAEANTLEELAGLFDRQLEALRAGEADELAEMATRAQTCTATLEKKRQEGERQARLLRRVLGATDDASLHELIATLQARTDRAIGERLAEVHATVADRARAVNERSETLSFALRYAAELNHELLAAMQGGGSHADDVHTYTSTGQAELRQPSDDCSFVNTIG